MDKPDHLRPCAQFLARNFLARSQNPPRKYPNILWMAVLLCAVILAWLLYTYLQRVDVAASQRADVAPRYVWVQLMKDESDGTPGGRLARAIVTDGDKCPTVKEGDRTIAMRRRPPPAQAAFPILLCETELEPDSPARIGNRTLPLRAAEPNDIVLIGDTGCRMAYYSQDQSCFDNNDWRFKRNALSAAAKVSARSFILHLGDFHYREHACAESSANCGGSPYGDNWETWEAEFFEPADPLLRAAPWVIMRGNHEDCARAGVGWLFFFALPGERRKNAACESSLRKHVVNIGQTDDKRTRSLLVMDTSDEKNVHKAEDNCKQYEEQLNTLDQNGPDRPAREFWLAVHQPLWGRNMDGEQESNARVITPCVNTKTESALPVIREKFEKAKDKRLARLVLAGDNHAFQFFWPKTALTPIQIIAGNGGTRLDTLYPLLAVDTKAPPNKGRTEDKTSPRVWDVTSHGIDGSNLTLMQYGFTVLKRDGAIWTATQFDSTGSKIAACWFSEALSSAASSAGCELRP